VSRSDPTFCARRRSRHGARSATFRNARPAPPTSPQPSHPLAQLEPALARRFEPFVTEVVRARTVGIKEPRPPRGRIPRSARQRGAVIGPDLDARLAATTSR
jgi:hypothetical protein